MSAQRERFEEWAIKPPREWRIERWPGDEVKAAWPGQYRGYHVQCAWEAWQAACPEGWQAVPVGATDDMLDSAFYPGCAAIETWRGMLSAAPKPEDV